MFLPKWYFLNLNVHIPYKMLLDFSFFLHYLLKCIFYRKRESKGNLIFSYNGPKDPNFLQMKIIIIIIIIILVLLLNIFLCTIYFSSLIFFGWGVVIKQRENKKKQKFIALDIVESRSCVVSFISASFFTSAVNIFIFRRADP